MPNGPSFTPTRWSSETTNTLEIISSLKKSSRKKCIHVYDEKRLAWFNKELLENIHWNFYNGSIMKGQNIMQVAECDREN